MQYFTIPMRHWKVSFSFHLNHLVIHQPLSKVVYTQLKILACSVNLFHRVKITTHLSSPGASRSLGCATERMTVGITLMRGTVIQVGGDGDSGGDDDGDGDDRDGEMVVKVMSVVIIFCGLSLCPGTAGSLST